jgi:uncharacterized protein (DUF433 family)
MQVMLEAYPRLVEADVHEALAFYRAHQSELDERIEAHLAYV